jgi:membrane protease YdiL (CAAX protease family)
MLVNFSNKSVDKVSKGEEVSQQKRHYRWDVGAALALWTLVGFGLAQAILGGVLFLLDFLNISLIAIDDAVLQSVVAILVYGLSLTIVIGMPLWIMKYRTSKQDMGMNRLLAWMDIGLAPAGFVVYFLVSALLVYLIGLAIPGFNVTQIQENGFGSMIHYYQLLLAFITLIIVAPIAEEVLFRGFLYGKLRKVVPIWVAIFATSVIFGLVHWQWNVAIDVFALSIILCSLREITGNIWAGVLLHMLKNSIAFYVLFINPLLLHTIIR